MVAARITGGVQTQVGHGMLSLESPIPAIHLTSLEPNQAAGESGLWMRQATRGRNPIGGTSGTQGKAAKSGQVGSHERANFFFYRSFDKFSPPIIPQTLFIH